MSDFCSFKFDGLGTECTRCRCWRRGTEPPDCPPYVTRCEPDNKRLPHLTEETNAAAFKAHLRSLDPALADPPA